MILVAYLALGYIIVGVIPFVITMWLLLQFHIMVCQIPLSFI